jgi:tetratricopeptide (TPR) repeat protein
MVVHSLVHRPHLFNSYISLEGALWWNEHRIVKDAKAVLGSPSYAGKTLFLAMAEHMEKPMSLQQIRRDKTSDSDLVRSNLELIDYLAKQKKVALKLGKQYYPNDHHSSLTLQAQQDALRFIFDFYPLYIHSKQKFNPQFDVVARYSSHYQDLSMKMGYIVKPEASAINRLGYDFLRRKMYAKSEFFFQQLVSNYPNDPNSYDSMGDFYLANGDKSKAIESFKKGLSIGEMKETRQKLDALLSEK